MGDLGTSARFPKLPYLHLLSPCDRFTSMEGRVKIFTASGKIRLAQT